MLFQRQPPRPLARNNLRSSGRAVDRLTKRFYQKLKAEARTNPALAETLDQIDTGPDLPETLGVARVVQGGDDPLHVVVTYEANTFSAGAVNTVEWMIDGVDQKFSHGAAVVPAGNELGPFAVGQKVKLRTRMRTGTGTRTGAVRSVTLAAPVV